MRYDKGFAVLMILFLLTGLVASALLANAEMKDLLGTLSDNKEFSTLAGVIKAAGLDKTLMGTQPYTILAPNNNAFNKLAGDTLRSIVSDTGKLSNILSYHVIPGKITTSQLLTSKELRTVDGRVLPVKITPDAVFVGGSRVMGPGMECTNGMIYQIDNVIIPPTVAVKAAPPVTQPVIPQKIEPQVKPVTPAAPEVARQTGSWLDWLGLLLGALILAGILLWALPRLFGKRREEKVKRSSYVEPEKEKIVLDETAVNELLRMDKSKLGRIQKYILGPYNDFKDMIDFVKDANISLTDIRDINAVRNLADKYGLNIFNSDALETALENRATIYTKDPGLMEKYRAAGAKSENINKLLAGL
jgi:uncharacterized surface protein with fasciclin (FAS1) repeats